MNQTYNYKSFFILYVDDEPLSLKYFRQAYEEKFLILVAKNAEEGLALFEEHLDRIGIIITDQRMPAGTGVELLNKIRHKHPKVIRMLATAYADIEAAIAAVNAGAIYKYITKPWDERELEITLMRALEFFIVQTERDELLREKLSAFHRILMTDRLMTLGILASKVGFYFKNSISAMKSFLDLVPSEINQDEFSIIQQLKDPDYWIEFYRNVTNRLERISSQSAILTERPATSTFNDVELKLSELITNSYTDVRAVDGWGGRTLNIKLPAFEPSIRLDLGTGKRMMELIFKNLSLTTPLDTRIEGTINVATMEGNTHVLFHMPYRLIAKDAFNQIFLSSANKLPRYDTLGTDFLELYFLIYHNQGSITLDPPGRVGFTVEFRDKTGENLNLSCQEDYLSKVFEIEEIWQQQLLS